MRAIPAREVAAGNDLALGAEDDDQIFHVNSVDIEIENGVEKVVLAHWRQNGTSWIKKFRPDEIVELMIRIG